MTATLSINFEDGTSKQIELTSVIEMRITPERRQSLEFRETTKGWVMAYTTPLFEDKKISDISIYKNAN